MVTIQLYSDLVNDFWVLININMRTPEQIREYRRQWGLKNKDKIKQQEAQRYQDNKDKYLRQSSKWHQDNKQRKNELAKQWLDAHPDYKRMMWSNRRARKKQATVTWCDYTKVRDWYTACSLLAEHTGTSYQVDHIVPIAGNSVCGFHVHNNLRIISAEENNRKNNKLDESLL